ncbi:hypothetical protein [Nocardia sp. NPDC024068]|uniref:hypothetical protein n=1 Tax=Nocardia sp. NPDC024068 TaxID=3157197 RepID=UPI0034011228
MVVVALVESAAVVRWGRIRAMRSADPPAALPALVTLFTGGTGGWVPPRPES